MLKFLFATLTLLNLSTAFSTPIKIGASSALSTAGIYIAQEKGYFKAAGLETEIIVLTNSTAQMTTLLAKNELQVGAGNLIAGLFNAYAAGEKFKIVADKGHLNKNSEYLWLMVRKDLFDSKKVQKISDLKGLKIGLPSIEGSSQQIALDSILKSEKLSIKDITPIKVGYSDMKLALEKKEIDAAVQLEPYLSDIVEAKLAIKFKSVQKFRPDQQSAVIIFSEKFAADKTSAQKFMSAYLKGIGDYNESLKSKEKWIEMTALVNKYAKIDGEKTWSKIENVGLNNDGSLNVESIKSDYSWYKDNSFIKGDIKLEDIIDLSFIKK